MLDQKSFKFQRTTATDKIFDLTKRIRVVAGGTAASKTISILVWSIDRAIEFPKVANGETELISVVSESYPHLQGGAMRDFESIMKDRGYWEDSRWHGTNHTYTFPSGSRIEFLSVDNYGKAHGPRRDILFINEGNYMDYKIVDQLITRTRKIVWLDFNPTNEFWFYTEMLPNRNDIDFITLTYKDNEALDRTTIDEIESHMNNKQWWRVYGEGQLGEVEGRVFTGWQIIDDIPHEAKLERRGQDFGYSNDPSAIIDVYKYNGGIILDEQLYQKGLSNKQLADFIKNLEQPQLTVYADSSEPKSIDEIYSYGVNIRPAQKGANSINQGIAYMQDQKISVTKRSVNLIKEYRNYMWETDKEGKILNKPIDMFNHAMDATRYALESYWRNSFTGTGIVTAAPNHDVAESYVAADDGRMPGYSPAKALLNQEDYL